MLAAASVQAIWIGWSTLERDYQLTVSGKRCLGNNAQHSKRSHIVECLNPFIDPQSWLLFMATFSLTVTNGGLGNFVGRLSAVSIRLLLEERLSKLDADVVPCHSAATSHPQCMGLQLVSICKQDASSNLCAKNSPLWFHIALTVC